MYSPLGGLLDILAVINGEIYGVCRIGRLSSAVLCARRQMQLGNDRVRREGELHQACITLGGYPHYKPQAAQHMLDISVRHKKAQPRFPLHELQSLAKMR